eukprot:11400797-Alexandrium_andersonii.AAC.1
MSLAVRLARRRLCYAQARLGVANLRAIEASAGHDRAMVRWADAVGGGASAPPAASGRSLLSALRM